MALPIVEHAAVTVDPAQKTTVSDPIAAKAYAQAETAAAFLKDPNAKLDVSSPLPSQAQGQQLKGKIEDALRHGKIGDAVPLLYALQYNAQGNMLCNVTDNLGRNIALLDNRFGAALKADARTGLANEKTDYQNFAVIGLAYIEATKQLLQGDGKIPLNPKVEKALNQLAVNVFERMQNLETFYPHVKNQEHATTIRAQAEITKLIDDALVPLLQHANFQAPPPKHGWFKRLLHKVGVLHDKPETGIRKCLAEVRDFMNFEQAPLGLHTLARTTIDEKFHDTEQVKRSIVAEEYHAGKTGTVFIDTLEADYPILLPPSFIGKYYGNRVEDLKNQDWFLLLEPHIQDAIRLNYDGIKQGFIPTQLRAYLPGFRNMYHKQGFALDANPQNTMHQFSDAHHSGTTAHDFKNTNKEGVKQIRAKAEFAIIDQKDILRGLKLSLAHQKKQLKGPGTYPEQSERIKAEITRLETAISETSAIIKRLTALRKDPAAVINTEVTLDAMRAQAEALDIKQEHLFVISLLSPVQSDAYLNQLYAAEGNDAGHVINLAQNFLRRLTFTDTKAKTLLYQQCEDLFNKYCTAADKQQDFRKLLDIYARGEHAAANEIVEAYLPNEPDKALALKTMLQLLVQLRDAKDSSFSVDSENANMQTVETLKRLGTAMKVLGGKETVAKFISQCLSGKDRDGIASFKAFVGDLTSYIAGGLVRAYKQVSNIGVWQQIRGLFDKDVKQKNAATTNMEQAFDQQYAHSAVANIPGNVERIPKSAGGSLGMEGIKNDSKPALPRSLKQLCKAIGASLFHDEASFNKKAPKHPVLYRIPFLKLFAYKAVAANDNSLYRTTVALAIAPEPKATATGLNTPLPALRQVTPTQNPAVSSGVVTSAQQQPEPTQVPTNNYTFRRP